MPNGWPISVRGDVAQHAHAARPLRARDRWNFSAILCGALAAADAQSVSRVTINAISEDAKQAPPV